MGSTSSKDGFVSQPAQVSAAGTTTTTTTTNDGGGTEVRNTKESDSACPVTAKSGGSCPMKSRGAKEETSSSPPPPPSSESACPVRNGGANAQQQQYNVYSQPIDPTNQMPANPNQLPSAGQTENLSKERVQSTIPKGGTENSTWVYPSPQMFYNALARKNKLDDTKEEDIESVVALHNNMNEKTWAKVLEWEALRDGDVGAVKLSRFLGRPSDLSPKARFKHLVLGHPLPFDRHDWTVVRPDGTEARYVIDYYHDESQANETEGSGTPAMGDREAVRSILVDVRPAADSVGAVLDRVARMPVARSRGTSIFSPLPLRPTTDMVAQVAESRAVWANIQRAVSEGGGGDDDAAKERDDDLTTKEAIALAKNLASVLRRCQEAKEAVDACEDEAEHARASLALSMCMAKIVCPLQHGSVVKVLDEHGDDDDGTVVETALENMVRCVSRQNERTAHARSTYPDFFAKE